MKKYLIGFGLAVIFFAGFSSVWAQAQGGNSGATSQNSSNGSNSNSSWKPVYIEDSDVNSYNACKDAGGTWITVPLSGNKPGDEPREKACLRIEKTDDKTAACDDLNFDTIRDFGDIEVEPFDNNYKVSVIGKVEYKGNGYYIGSGHEKIEVKCYEYDDKTKKLGKMLYGKELTDKNICLVDKNDLRITAIDFSRDSYPEWYCPYNWAGQYPEGVNPYSLDKDNSKETYYQKYLKDKVYKFTPEDSSELMHDCARRIYALGRACAKRVERATRVVDKIKKLRNDFYRKIAVRVWRGNLIEAKGIKAYNQWLEVKDMPFKEICGEVQNGECNENVWKDNKGKNRFGDDKTNAIKAVQKWLKVGGNKNLMEESKTPAKYFRNKAEEIWNNTDAKTVKAILKEGIGSDSLWGKVPQEESDQKKLEDYMGGVYKDKDFKFTNKIEWSESGVAKDEYSKLLKEANEENHSATMVSRYISQRSNDLNVAVSNIESGHIEVTRLLRAYDGSKEADLIIFDDRKDGEKMINVFDKIINLAVQTMGTLAILLLIISGVLMVVSQGDENQLSQAKTVFIYTLIGLIVGFLSYTIVRFVIDTLLS